MVCNVLFACFSAAVTNVLAVVLEWIDCTAGEQAGRSTPQDLAGHEQFQFGAGAPIKSHEKAWIAGAMEQCCLIFGVICGGHQHPFSWKSSCLGMFRSSR